MKATEGSKIFFTLLLLSVCSASFSQEKSATTVKDTFNIRSGSFLLPQRLPKGKYSHAIYILYIVPPKDWTLDAVVAPMFQYSGKYTLDKGFNLQGSLATLIISNRLSAGPFWNYEVNNFRFGVGYQVAFNFGILNQFGFHTMLTGWEQQPSLTAGYSFGKTAVTLRGDLYYTNQINFIEAGNVISNNSPFINGYSVNGSFEQRITKNRVMSLGFKLSYLRYHILAWPALPVNSYRYFVPEFQVGLNF
jgi:hypothetical protein